MSETMKLKDQIYEKVLNEITEGRYLQNEIITERELIEKYGVSKSPVREALIELCNENVLVSRPRMGYQIRPISMKEISDIVELRVILELAALRKTFTILDDHHIQLLKENLSRASEIHEGKNMMKHWKSNISFHLLLCSFCGNSQIYSETERALKFSYRGCLLYTSIEGKDLTMIFQEPLSSLNPLLTCGYQIVETLRYHEKISKKEAWAKAEELLEMVGIPMPAKRAREYPHQLSGGMRQRVMIAMAIACNLSLIHILSIPGNVL